MAAEKYGLSLAALARAVGVHERTFQGYLKRERQDNLWPLLPKILEELPRLSRQWLYFEEGPATIGLGVPPEQPVPLRTVMHAVEQMAQDAEGTNRTLLQMVAGMADETTATERVRQLEEEKAALEAELKETNRMYRQATARLLLEGSPEKDSAQNAGGAAASGRG